MTSDPVSESNKLLFEPGNQDLAKDTGIWKQFLEPLGKAPTRLFFSSLTTVRVPEIGAGAS